jgi:myo-inositol-1(or 4)-monophosphatase
VNAWEEHRRGVVKSDACKQNGTSRARPSCPDVAREAALAAGAELTARYGRSPRGVGAKLGPADLVSDADRAAEAAIAGVLARRRPGDGILGEEGTADREGTTGLRWVVDPLDGTVNYLAGIPLWCVSIACEDHMGTLAGMVHDPLREQTFATVRGGPVHVDAPSIRERPVDDLAAATIAGGIACATEAEAKRAAKLEKRLFSRIGSRRMLGTAALELAWAAAGRIDVVYHEQRIHPWDVDAGLFICQRAGMRVHRLEPLEPALAPRYLAAPPDLAAEVLHLIGPSAKERRRAAERAPLSAQRVAEAMRRRRPQDPSR